MGNLTDLSEVKFLFKKYKIWAKKRFGQNFLVDQHVLECIIAAASLHSSDKVLEIGPGYGVLTRELLPRTRMVQAVEIDREIIPVLKETTKFFKEKIEIIHAHILDVSVPKGRYKIVANIPYHLTSPILRKFLVETEDRPQSLTFLVQKEVAEKICDRKKRSILSLFVEVFGEASIVCTVSPQSFFPAPKVFSAVLHIHLSQCPIIGVPPAQFFHVVKMGFSQPRKKLKNNISPDILKKAHIDENLRAECLDVSDWERIVTVFSFSVRE
jgi:16S rRNA (adenine1518-N6/adenine1519-N6)-dimethyltransferase